MYDPYASVFKQTYPPNPYGNPGFTSSPQAFIQPAPAFVAPIPAFVTPALAPFVAPMPVIAPQVTPSFSNPFEQFT